MSSMGAFVHDSLELSFVCQFYTVLNSRFGSTTKLALEKEDENVLSAFMEAFAPKPSSPAADEKKQEDLEAEFDAEEEKLKKGSDG